MNNTADITTREEVRVPQLLWVARHPFLRHKGEPAYYELRRVEVMQPSGHPFFGWCAYFNGGRIGAFEYIQSGAEHDCEQHLIGTLAVTPFSEQPPETPNV